MNLYSLNGLFISSLIINISVFHDLLCVCFYVSLIILIENIFRV